MKFLTSIFIIFLLTSYSIIAKEIPIEHFAKNADFINIKISPNGEHYAFTFRDNTQVNLAVMRKSDKKILGVFEFGEWKQVIDFHWGNDERVLMEVEKRVGFLDERGSFKSLYAGNINGKKKIQLIKIENYWYSILSTLKDDPKNILITKNYNTEDGKSKPTKLNIYNGRQVYTGDVPAINARSLVSTKSGDVRFAVEFETNDDNVDLIKYKIAYKNPDNNDWSSLTLDGLEGKPGATFTPLAVSPNKKYAYISSNVSTKTNSLLRVDLSNGIYKIVSQNERVDLGGLIYAEDGTPLAAVYDDGYTTLDFLGTGHPEEQTYKSLLNSFPDSKVSLTSYTADKQFVTLFVRNDINPGDFYLFNLKDKTAEFVASTMEWINPKNMAEMRPISYTARDGVTIHGYLTVPKDSDGKNLPLIMHPHGGPHGPRDDWGYDRHVQLMASRGYAVLQTNFRGSGGYGYEFQQMGYRKWGTEMQDDLTDGVKWAINEGIANADKVCIFGGSYGGYASLMSVTREPDLYKCALGYVGVYDLKVMKTAGDIPRTKSGKSFLKRVLGTDSKQLEAHSPSYNVDKIKAALFIVHGSEDVRVPMEQYYSLTNALDKAEIEYESMVKPEGHGYTQPKNAIEFFEKAEVFFDKHIGSASN